MKRIGCDDSSSSTDGPSIVLDAKILRAFAGGIADLCCRLGLVQYDIVCRFTPRERLEYAGVETRFRNGRKAVRSENIIPVPLSDKGLNALTEPK